MRFALFPALLLLAACASSAREGDGRIAIEARPIPFDVTDAARREIGKLAWRGGLVLRASHARFGGFSALRCPDRCIAVSDKGSVLEFGLVEREGRLSGVTAAYLSTIRDVNGEAGSKATRDSESLTLGPKADWAEIGFERTNAIFSFRRGEDGRFDWTASGGVRPEAMQGWPRNGGAETLLRLADGRVLAIAEDAETENEGRRALLFGPRPADSGGLRGDPASLTYIPPEGFRPTDAALTGDGRVLILNRSFSLMSGVGAVLTAVPVGEIRPGATLRGTEIARLAPPLSIDNMEALAVRREAGRTYVYLMSDDNFSPLQRTLLMKFELME
jgi:hypothetical protein